MPNPITPTPSAATLQLQKEAALTASGNKAGAVASSATYNQTPPAPVVPTTPPPVTQPSPAPAAAPPMPAGGVAAPTGASANTPGFTSKAPAASTPQQAALTWYQGIINGSTPYNPSDPNASTYLQALAQMGVAGASNIQALGASGVGRAQQNYTDAQSQISDRISNAYSNIQNILANGQNTPQQQAAVQSQIAGIQGYLNVAANYGIPLTGIAYQDANGNWIAGTAAAPSPALAGNAGNVPAVNGTTAPVSTPPPVTANGGNSGTTSSGTSVAPAGTTAPPAPGGNGSTVLPGGGTSTPITPAAGANASGSAITLADAGGPAGSNTLSPPPGSTLLTGPSQLAGLTESQIFRGSNGQIYALPGVTPGGGGSSFGSTGSAAGGTGGAGGATGAPVSTQVPGASTANGMPGSSGYPAGSIQDLKAQITYFQGQIISAEAPTADETTLQNTLDTLNEEQEAITSTLLSNDVNVEGQPIAQAFVTGQQAALQRKADAQSAALGVSQTNVEDQLKELQAKRATALDTATSDEQFAEENYAAAVPAPVALAAGASLVNPLTGATVANGAPKEVRTGSTTDPTTGAVSYSYGPEPGTGGATSSGGSSSGSTSAPASTGGGLGTTTSTPAMKGGLGKAVTPTPTVSGLTTASGQPANYQDASGTSYYVAPDGTKTIANIPAGGAAKSSATSTSSKSTGTPLSNPNLESVAQALADGTIAPSQVSMSRGGAGEINQVEMRASQINPNFNAAEAQKQYGYATTPATITQAQAIVSAYPNFDTLINLAKNANYKGPKTLNNIQLESGVEFGNTNAANFAQAQKLLGDDIAGILGYGSASDLKTQLGLDVVDPTLTVDQFTSNMNQLKGFVDNKINAINSQAGMYAQGLLNLPVQVTSPDGTTGWMPASNLQKALSQGFTQIQTNQ